ncbi:MAG: prolyl oligopeptidase family serine peptidase [Deltaproteobacteria bacterium]|nr:prolyl oligopeptidase family serine peptidase [Deltaproteobacteria bacterium]
MRQVVAAAVTLALALPLAAACVVERAVVREPCVCETPVAPVCPSAPPPVADKPPADTVTSIDGTVIELRRPAGAARGTILVLPGWGFDRRMVCWRSSFCDDARAAGWNLVLAGMDKSVYAGEVYPQTRHDMAVQKTRTWVVGRLLPALQERYGVLRPGEDNFLYGMSTGGRGVALLALHAPEIFRGGAALSGDFDMLLETKDPLLLLHYGSHRRFPERWSGEDNPALHAARIRIPLYLASGTADKIVPAEQSIQFHRRMREAHPDMDLHLELVDGAGHDFGFWGSQTGPILEFFAKHARGATPALMPAGTDDLVK